MNRSAALLATSAFGLMLPTLAGAGSPYDAMIAQHAAANGVPVELVHRVIVRESRYNPRAVNSGNYGMMQIRLQTARGMGYTGTAQGLLDPNTNLTYAVKYLAGAYKVAGGNHNRAVSLYASGYYYAAKRKGMTATTGAPVFASLGGPGQPASFGAGPAMQMPMSDAGAPPPVLQPGTREGNRAFRAAKAADAARSRAAARNAAAANGAPFSFSNPFKDQSRPRSARATASNPFAAMFKQEAPRRSRHRS